MTAENEVYILRRLNYYKNLGINLWAESGRLKFRSENKMSADIREELLKDKELLLNFFAVDRDFFELTPIQSAYIAGGKEDYELGNTNAHYYTEYESENIDAERMQSAINAVIRENDALRLVVSPEGKQRVLNEVPEYVLDVNKADTLEIREKWSHHIYPLNEFPMFHFEVSRNNDKDVLHFSFDCIIMDAWSAKMLLERIFSLYHGETVKKTEYSFERYMHDISGREKTLSDKKAEEYWNKRTAEMPPCPVLDYRCPFSDVKTIRYKRLAHSFSREETEKLYERLKKMYITPSAFMCTVFLKVMSHYSKNKDISLDLTLFSRQPLNREINNVLGDFTNVGFVSYSPKQNETFINEVKAVSAQFWKLVEFRSYDGTKVLKELSKKKMGKAVMPIVFTSTLQGIISGEKESDFREVFAISQTPQTAIDHQLRDDMGFLSLTWDYITALFDEKYICGMFGTYAGLAGKIMNENDWNKVIDVRGAEEI